MQVEYVWSDKKRLWCGLPWTFTRYSFNKELLVIDSGVLVTIQEEIRLYRVMDITLSRTLLQRFFGLSSISLNTSDKSAGTVVLKNIKDGDKVKALISEFVENCRDSKRIYGREIMSDMEID